MKTAFPEKIFYKIGEVSQILGVKPHVLRYWESQFEAVRPRKTRSGQRLYRRQDVALLETVRNLLHEQGFTIAGARRKLAGESNGTEEKQQTGPSTDKEAALGQELERRKKVIEELRQQVEDLMSLVES